MTDGGFRLERPLLPPHAAFDGSWPMASNRPIADWRYFRHHGAWGGAVKAGRVFRRLTAAPGRLMLFDHPDEIPPVMRAFSLFGEKGRKGHGRR